jgi:hypothetical protein
MWQTAFLLTAMKREAHKRLFSFFILSFLGGVSFEEYLAQHTERQYTLEGGAGGVKCLICGKVTLHTGNMRQHFEVYHYRRQYTCEFCQRVCKTKNSLDVHRKTRHLRN